MIPGGGGVLRHPSHTTGLMKPYTGQGSGNVDKIKISQHAHNTSGSSTEAFYSLMKYKDLNKRSLLKKMNCFDILDQNLSRISVNDSKLIHI